MLTSLGLVSKISRSDRSPLPLRLLRRLSHDQQRGAMPSKRTLDQNAAA